MQAEVLDFGRVLEGMDAVLRASAGERVDLRVEVEADVALVLACRSEVEQMIVGLALSD